MSRRNGTTPTIEKEQAPIEVPTEAPVHIPGYIIIHENGSVDMMRVEKTQVLHYAELLVNIAGQMLNLHRNGNAPV